MTDITLKDGEPLIFSVIAGDGPDREATVRRLLPENPHIVTRKDAWGSAGQTLLHEALKSRAPSVSLISDLLRAGVDPFKRDNDGIPAFLAVNFNKPTATKELELIVEALLKNKGLSQAEKALIKAQYELLNAQDSGFDNAQALKMAWKEANRFAPNSTDKVPEKVKIFLEPLLSPARAPKFMEALRHSQVSRRYDGSFRHYNGNIDDMMREFTAHVVLPQCLMEYSRQLGIPLTNETLLDLEKKYKRSNGNIAASCGIMKNIGILHDLLPVVRETLLGNRAIDTTIRLLKAWNEPRISFPYDLMPIKSHGEWYPLSSQRSYTIPETGITLHELNCDEDMKSVGRLMDNCLTYNSGYIDSALKGETHYFSLHRNGEETPFDILKCWFYTDDNNNKVFNYTSSNWDHDDRNKAGEWLKEELKSGAIKANAKSGETDESKEIKARRPEMLRIAGYEITQDNINAAFEEYKSEKRRARNYNPQTDQFDIVDRQVELITGSLETASPPIDPPTDGKPKKVSIPFKQLSAEAWFEASGLREKAMAVTFQPIIDEALEERKAQSNHRQRAGMLRHTPGNTWDERRTGQAAAIGSISPQR